MSNSYCFVSPKGEFLPRWREAFPSAMVCRLDGKVSRGVTGGNPRGSTAPLVWVYLPAGETVSRVLETVRKTFGDTPIIAMGNEPNDEEALDCFAAGVRGYCNAHAAAELLVSVAEVVQQGGLWIGESLMQRLLQGTARIPLPLPAGAPPDWAALLTEREREVAVAVAEGASNKEVARKLGITERTVKAHTGAIFEKLDVRDRLQLSLIVHGRQRH